VHTYILKSGDADCEIFQMDANRSSRTSSEESSLRVETVLEPQKRNPADCGALGKGTVIASAMTDAFTFLAYAL
jgi:hypothetical protein